MSCKLKVWLASLIMLALWESGLDGSGSGLQPCRLGWGYSAERHLTPVTSRYWRHFRWKIFGTYVEQFRLCIRDRKESMLISSVTMYNHDLYDDFIRFNIDTDSEQGWVDNRSSISRKINPTLFIGVNSYLLLWQCLAYCFLLLLELLLLILRDGRRMHGMHLLCVLLHLLCVRLSGSSCIW